MSLKFCSFSSGSSGNCYLVKSENHAVLVDAGISCKKIYEGLEKTETDLSMLNSVLITHEHIDHVSGIRVLTKKAKHVNVYANKGTFANLDNKVAEERRKYFESGDSFEIGDIEIKTFPISHDAADPVGFSLRHMGSQISIVTDTGIFDENNIDEIIDADILVIEANHDIDMLKNGRYHWELKQRVLSEFGHLSNHATGELLTKLYKIKKKARCILLAHLSNENNVPEVAVHTICNILEESDLYVDVDYYIKPMQRGDLSLIYEI